MEFRGYENEKVQDGFDATYLKRLWPFVRPYRRAFGAALGILFLSFGIEILGPYLVRRVIDGPISNAARGEDAAFTEVLGLGAAYLSLAIVGTVLGYVYAMITARSGQRVVRDLRVHLFDHLLRLSPRFFDKNPAGKLVTRITSDVENLNELIATGVLQTTFDLLKIVGVLAVLFWLDLKLALFGAIVIPLLVVVSLLFRRFARDAYRKVRGRLAKQNAYSAEIVSGVRAIRAYGREDDVQRTFDDLNAETRDGWQRTIFSFAVFFAIVELALRSSQAGLLFVGGSGILEGTITAGLFVQFWLYFQKLGEPIRELGEKYNVLQSAFSSAERIFSILGESPAPQDPASPRPCKSGPAEVEFDGVSFSYVEGVPVLKDRSFVVPAGTTCAFIGPTGAGKSTILSLVSRLQDPDSGTVRIDGHDIREYAVADVRRRVAVVPQDVFLFTGTVLDNLRLFDDSISEARCREALETVGAATFVDGLEGGMHAQVEERGATFSQGERQLLAMARVLCHDPDVLILDEATANIDSANEARIQRALEVLFRDRTVLVVAHRLSTVEDADQVVIVEPSSAIAPDVPSH